jgi:hypothetical protein
MADGVDARVETEQASPGQTHFDRSFAHAERGELSTRDHSVLTLGQLCDSRIQPTVLL